jgi:hypothetical protein
VVVFVRVDAAEAAAAGAVTASTTVQGAAAQEAPPVLTGQDRANAARMTVPHCVMPHVVLTPPPGVTSV